VYFKDYQSAKEYLRIRTADYVELEFLT